MPAITRAIVRPPGSTFANGLTSGSGAPDVGLARVQHAAYCDALRRCGVEVIELPPSDAFPDATFVEDVAVIAGGKAMLTRPGAPSRRGEVDLIRGQINALFSDVREIAAPGTLDGGDVCDAGTRFLIGMSDRTNPSGAEQLARWLESFGRRTEIVDVRKTPGLLHFKSAVAFLADEGPAAGGTFVAAQSLRSHPVLSDKRVIQVDNDETYAANCLRVNDRVLVAAGFPHVVAALTARGYDVVELDVSEFEKMDGGLSCLSLRF